MGAPLRDVTRVLVAAVFFQSVVSQVAPSYQVTISPRSALSPIRAPNKTFKVMCTASQDGKPVPLNGCQFYQGTTILDFSKGPASVQHPDYMYQGAGLDKGECGVVLGGSRNWGNFMIGCRVKAASGGGWKYDAMVLDVSNFLPMNYTLQGPRKLVVLPGTSINLLGDANLPLDRCRIHLSDTYWLDFNQGHASPTTSNLRYFGAGLPEKQCGIAMSGLTPQMSGFVRANVKSPAPDPDEKAFRGVDYITLIVASPPEAPHLTLSTKVHKEGDMLEATCVVANSRPVANITWYIGDTVVRQDATNEATVETQWRWEFEPQTIVQKLSHKLTAKDDGKVVKCQAGHLALPGGVMDSEKVAIRIGQTATKVEPPTAGFQLTINPRSALSLIRSPTSTVNIMCTATQDGRPVPLSGCQFYQGTTILDFSKGPASPQNADVKYQGAGLEKGECGAVLGGNRNWGNYMIGCRVRAASGGGWKYNAMVLDVSNFLPMKFAIQGPRKLVVLPGSDISIVGDGDKPLERCRIHMSDTYFLNFNQGHASPSTNTIRYHGTSLEEKQCGVSLDNVTSQMSGFVRGNVKSPAPDPEDKAFRGVDYITLIVAAPPERPVLTMGTKTFKDGDTLSATCTVANSRPVSNVSWFIGGVVVRQDAINDAPFESEWRWEYEPQTIVQNLSYTVNLKDDGKEIKCQAEHLALSGGFADSEKIIIRVSSK